MPTLNPWTYMAALLAALAIFAAGHGIGHKTGTNAQKVTDQAEFDRINAALTAQKALAQASLNSANQANAQRREDVGKTIAQLEKTHAENQKLTDRNRALLDAYQLRWRAAESAGSWGGSTNPETDPGGATSSSAAAECQLPKPLAESLAGILLDADRLRDDYALIYDERHAVSCY